MDFEKPQFEDQETGKNVEDREDENPYRVMSSSREVLEDEEKDMEEALSEWGGAKNIFEKLLVGGPLVALAIELFYQGPQNFIEDPSIGAKAICGFALYNLIIVAGWSISALKQKLAKDGLEAVKEELAAAQ